MFSQEDIIKFKKFAQEIINSPNPIEQQKFIREKNFLWCTDWEIIEILKYLFNGEDMYLTDPPPNRLKNNPLWSKEEIIKAAKEIIENSDNSDEIIKKLKKKRNNDT